jgi:CheY-like chemotaxis protein
VSHHKKQPQVLFVDDEPDFLRLVTDTFAALSDNRWRVYSANSADAALKVLGQRKIDLAVLDINMPLLDGIQFLRILSRRYPDVKKVILTGFGTEERRTECLANGAELFIEKPHTIDGFKSVFVMLDELCTWTPQQGFRGMLRQVGLNDIIQMECLGRNSSMLEIRSELAIGHVYIKDGNLIHATFGELVGEPALHQLLSFNGGEFRLLPFETPSSQSLRGPWELLLMEAAQARDESYPAADAPVSAPTGPTPPNAQVIPPLTRTPPATSPAGPPPLPANRAATPPPLPTPHANGTAPGAPLSAVIPPFTPGPVPAALPPRQPNDPVIAETLICNAEGAAVYLWQCPNSHSRLALLRSLTQQAALLSQSLPLGKFERLEILQPGQRIIAAADHDRIVFVRSQRPAIS